MSRAVLALLVGSALTTSLVEPAPAQSQVPGAAATAPAPPVRATLGQLMKGTLYPASNVVFAAQDENPGLINEIGKFWEKSKTILPPLKSPQEALDDLNSRATDASRDAGESLSRLAKPSLMVSGRMGCPVSANGAPDCKAGADKLCQAKGHKEGKSLDTDAAEKCSAKVYLPGRKREPGDCRTEHYVTRALCQ